MLALVPSTLKWKLMDRQPIATWVHSAGRLVLLGDACHPMLVCLTFRPRFSYLRFYQINLFF